MNRNYFFLLLILVSCLGCFRGGTGNELTPVTGTVSLDDKPIANGLIEFRATDRVTSPFIASIEDGNFSAHVAAGEFKVVIRSEVKTGKEPMYAGEADSPMVDIVKEAIPAKYNDKSSLTLEVTGAPVQIDYKLDSM